MTSAPPDQPDHEWRRGWPVVVGAMVGIGTGPGLFQNLSSLFTPGMIAEFGWSRGDIATAAGLGLVGGLAAPFLGRLADRVGVRAVIVAAMLLLGAAYLGLAAIGGALWQYQLLILCLALSVPGTSMMVYGKLIAATFSRHRGFALGVATSGLSITTLALPSVVAAVIAAQGWRGGFVALAVLVAAVALPLVLLAIRGVPAGPTRPDPSSAHAGDPVTGLTGREARRQRNFSALAAAVMLINMATVGLVTQLVPFGLDRGLSPAEAALLLVSYGASQVAGRLAMGLLVDRFRPQAMAAIVGLLSAAGFVALQLDAPGFAMLMTAVFVAGLMNGADHDLLPFFAARLFGLRAYGEIYGSLLALSLLGTATGIVAFGRLHDATGGYTVALWLASGALVLSALAFLSLRERALPEVRAAAI